MKAIKDPVLEAIDKLLIDIHRTAMPVALLVTKDSVEYVYSAETQRRIDYWQDERLKRFKEIYQRQNFDHSVNDCS